MIIIIDTYVRFWSTVFRFLGARGLVSLLNNEVTLNNSSILSSYAFSYTDCESHMHQRTVGVKWNAVLWIMACPQVPKKESLVVLSFSFLNKYEWDKLQVRPWFRCLHLKNKANVKSVLSDTGLSSQHSGGSQIQTHPRYMAGHCLKKHDFKKNAKGIYLKTSWKSHLVLRQNLLSE